MSVTSNCIGVRMSNNDRINFSHPDRNAICHNKKVVGGTHKMDNKINKDTNN